MLDFQGSSVLVTGGSRGIGKATALMFARSGANVAFTYHVDAKAARALNDEISALGRFSLPIRCRVESYADCSKAVSLAHSEMGAIDVLVNSAGIWRKHPISRTSVKDWEQSIRVNLTGTFNTCRRVVPIMRKQKRGKIINISSTAGQRGESFHSPYATAKGGIIAFTKSIAVELIRDGIRVNCVAPGWVDTDMVSTVMKKPDMKRKIMESIPRGQLGKPEDIAGPILFLASSLSDNIVGEILNVNGGSVLCG
jgi:3-oxoacyl-[acyl-carrier protein] reductase